MTSPRRSLRERLAQARARNWIDLRCTAPGMDGLYVRFRALSADELSDITERKNGRNAGIETALSVLSWTCAGVWEDNGDGFGVSPIDGFDGRLNLATGEVTGSLPTFSDPALGEALGCDDATAAAAVRALLAPSSDLRLMPYADQVVDFSTGANEKLARDSSGN